MQDAGKNRLIQVNEMDEFRYDAYKNVRIYKEYTKKWYDKNIVMREFHMGQQVLLYSSRLHLFPEKLKSRWTSPYTVTKVCLYGVVEISHKLKGTFKVNGHRLKHYIGKNFEEKKIILWLQDPT